MFKITRRPIGRALAFLWAAFWAYFSVVATVSEPGTPGQKILVCLVALLLFVGSPLVAWRYERIGGLLLLLEGAALCIANFTFLRNRPDTQFFLLLALALPPILAGLLLSARPRPEGYNGASS